jgi:hypothetical protein
MLSTSSPGSISPKNRNRLRRDALTCDDTDGAVVPRVSVLVTGAPLGVTLEGLNEQLAPVGRPLQLKLTESLNPPTGVTVMVEVPELPGTRLTDVGEAEMLKSGGSVTVSVTVADCVRPPPVPVTVIE